MVKQIVSPRTHTQQAVSRGVCDAETARPRQLLNTTQEFLQNAKLSWKMLLNVLDLKKCKL